MKTPNITTRYQTATAHDHIEEVKNMALRKRNAHARARAWDSLSESDKAVLLESARSGSRPRVERSDWQAATVIRRFQ